jgi:hypothetical protein
MWVGCPWTWETYGILVRKPLRKWKLGRWKSGQENNINVDHQEVDATTIGGCNWPSIMSSNGFQ